MWETLLGMLHLAPDSFPTRYLAIAVPIHASAAILAGVVLCPLAIFARKGTRLHRVAGYALQIDVVVIVVTSFLLLIDRQVDELVVQASVFPNGAYERLYLGLLSIVFAYYCFSGLRVWYRLPPPGEDLVTSNWIDWGLATAGLLVGITYVVTSIVTLGNSNPLSLVYIQAAILLIAFTLFDFYTFFFPPNPARFPWWLVHMAKMILIWIILIHFIILRLFEPDVSTYAVHQTVALLLYLGICLVAAFHFRRRFRVSGAV